MKTLLLVVVEIGPVCKHTLSKNSFKGEELLWIINLVLVVLREQAIQLAKTGLSLNVWPEISTEAVVVGLANVIGWAITVMSLLRSHIHIRNE